MSLTIYSASAGSGKTFTLVRKYLSLALRNSRTFQRILVLTFTNKAAEELRSRLLSGLRELSSENGGPLSKILCDELKCNAAELATKSRLLETRMLHEFSDLNITTIDSFFQKLIRTLSRELDLPGYYRLEMDLNQISRRILDQLLAQIGKTDSQAQEISKILFEELQLRFMQSDKTSWEIREPVLNKIKNLLANPAKRFESKIDDDFIQRVRLHCTSVQKNYTAGLIRIAGELNSVLRQSEFNGSDFAHGNSGAVGYVLGYLKKFPEQHKINKHFIKAAEGEMSLLSKSNQKNTTLVDLAENQVLPLVQEFYKFQKAGQEAYITASLLSKGIYLLEMEQLLIHQIRSTRQESPFMLLNESSYMLEQSIGENDSAFILEKTGTRFQYLFIDEFQDTSLSQWRILEPLVINLLSDSRDENVLLVGDAKQSIYRWRGGNSEIMTRIIPDKMKNRNQNVKYEYLVENRRSLQGIVDFNNLFFTSAAAELESDETLEHLFYPEYQSESVVQLVNDKKVEGGYVEFHFHKAPSNSRTGSSVDQNSEEDEEETELSEDKVFLRIKSKIHDLLSRGYAFRDILILVRNNSDEIKLIEQFQSYPDLPVSGENSLLVANHSAVIFLINCCRLLVLSRIGPAFSADMKFYSAEINLFMSDETIHLDALLRTPGWAENILLPQAEVLLHLPLDELISSVCNLADLAYLSNPYLTIFLDLVRSGISIHYNSPADLIDWWDQNSKNLELAVEMPASKDSVRIMTIHKSKGLQSPVVIVPYLNWSLLPKNGTEFDGSSHDPAYEHTTFPLHFSRLMTVSSFRESANSELRGVYKENINLLYVAFTRAECELYGFGARKNDKDKNQFKLPSTEWASQLLERQLTHQNFPAAVIGSEEDDFRFSMGELKAYKRQTQSKTNGGIFSPVPVPASENRNNAPVKSVRELKIQFESDEINFGKWVHRSLQLAKTKRDIPTAVRNVLATSGFGRGSLLADKLISEAEQAWELMKSQGWTEADHQQLAETDLCDESGNIFRPDRILLAAGGIKVIDFKTGKKSPSHQQQVGKYCELLARSGYQNISGHLVYTNPLSLEKVYPL